MVDDKEVQVDYKQIYESLDPAVRAMIRLSLIDSAERKLGGREIPLHTHRTVVDEEMVVKAHHAVLSTFRQSLEDLEQPGLLSLEEFNPGLRDQIAFGTFIVQTRDYINLMRSVFMNGLSESEKEREGEVQANYKAVYGFEEDKMISAFEDARVAANDFSIAVAGLADTPFAIDTYKAKVEARGIANSATLNEWSDADVLRSVAWIIDENPSLKDAPLSEIIASEKFMELTVDAGGLPVKPEPPSKEEQFALNALTAITQMEGNENLTIDTMNETQKKRFRDASRKMKQERANAMTDAAVAGTSWGEEQEQAFMNSYVESMAKSFNDPVTDQERKDVFDKIALDVAGDYTGDLSRDAATDKQEVLRNIYSSLSDAAERSRILGVEFDAEAMAKQLLDEMPSDEEIERQAATAALGPGIPPMGPQFTGGAGIPFTNIVDGVALPQNVTKEKLEQYGISIASLKGPAGRTYAAAIAGILKEEEAKDERHQQKLDAARETGMGWVNEEQTRRAEMEEPLLTGQEIETYLGTTGEGVTREEVNPFLVSTAGDTSKEQIAPPEEEVTPEEEEPAEDLPIDQTRPQTFSPRIGKKVRIIT